MTKNQVHGAAGLHYAGLVLSLARGKKKNKEREEEYKERSSNHLLLLACFATTLLTRKPRTISLSLSLSGGSNRATLILHILGTNIQVFFISYFDDQTGQDFFNAARDGVKDISEIEAISRENRLEIFNRISFFDRGKIHTFKTWIFLSYDEERKFIDSLFGKGIPLGKCRIKRVERG